MSFKKEYEVRLENLGVGNRANNIALLEMLEEIAEQNSAEVGFGLENYSKTNAAWLLLDWKVEIIKRPKYREKLMVETWSRKMERCYGYRDFEIYNKENELIVKGTSKWVLIDIEKRRPMRISEESAKEYDKYNDKGYTVFEDEIEKIEELKDEELSFVKNYEVQRRDIDVNKHMNNIAYLKVAYEILPDDVYEKNLFNNIRITYKKELMYGESTRCFYNKVDDKHIITMKAEDKVNAIIELY